MSTNTSTPKAEKKFYYTRIPKDISFLSSNILGTHQCTIAGSDCRHLYAASDEHGGCAKVRNHSKCIERYPWFTMGYESFNTNYDSFVVVNCLHYEQCPPGKKFSTNEIKGATLRLAQFLWEDVKNLEKVKARIAKNRNW